MASGLYNKGQYLIATQALNWTSTDIRVLLLKTGYTFDKDHNFVSDLTPASNEVTVGGYSRSAAIASPTITEDDANDRIKFDAADQAFGALATGETVIAAVLYKYNAADASAELLVFADFADTPTNGSTFTVQWHADGIFYWQQ